MIAWEESGTRFIVKDQLNFASKVLPQYYETSKFASFSRQLNIYGFYRVSDRRRTKQCSDTSTIIYSHQHFIRDQPLSLHLIQRMSGPHTQPKSRFPISKSNPVFKSTTPPLLPPLSPASTSTSSIYSQPSSIQGGEAKYFEDSTNTCPGCQALEQEIANLKRVIIHYTSILSESSELDRLKSQRTPTTYPPFPEARSSEMSYLTTPSSALFPFPLEENFPNPYSNVYPCNSYDSPSIANLPLFPNVLYL
ncbi:Heat shock transcription factor, variant 2 [Basidiobolus ranarum]